MLFKTKPLSILFALLAFAPTLIQAEEIKLKSGGPIAFGPKGVMFVSDPVDAKIFAVETGDTNQAEMGKVEVKNIDKKLAGMLGIESKDVRINDLAVNPASGHYYLSVTRGSETQAATLIFQINASSGKISEFKLGERKSTHVSIPNPATGRGRRGASLRSQSITDLTFIDGELYVAGLSNEEFASNLRAIPYPFKKSDEGSSIEIYHGAHGQFETRSPIRTFAAYEVAGDTSLLAAYTCTPLVQIPVSSLKPKFKVKGKTIAELGNRNRPLDMFVFKQGGKDFVLMANSSRGVMKIKLDEIAEQVAITERVSRGGTKGLNYDTIDTLKGVMQLDKVNDRHAVVLVKTEEGFDLKTIDMP